MMLGIHDSRSKITLSQTIEESRIGDIWSILNQSLQCKHKLKKVTAILFSVAAFEHPPQAVKFAVFHTVTMFRIGILTGPDLVCVFGKGSDCGVSEVGKALGKLRLMSLCQAENIVCDEYLAIAVRT